MVLNSFTSDGYIKYLKSLRSFVSIYLVVKDSSVLCM